MTGRRRQWPYALGAWAALVGGALLDAHLGTVWFTLLGLLAMAALVWLAPT